MCRRSDLCIKLLSYLLCLGRWYISWKYQCLVLVDIGNIPVEGLVDSLFRIDSLTEYILMKIKSNSI